MDSASEYSRRLNERKAECGRYSKLHKTIGNIRLAVGISAAVVTYFVFGRPILSPWWFILPALVFIALLVWHSRILDKREYAARVVRFYEKGIERVEHRWMGQGESGERYREQDHIYADDLDLFGRGSLFELLCIARTQAGEATLARWLKGPAGAEEVLERQQAVAELRGNLDLREDLAALAEVVRKNVDPNALAIWGEKPAISFPPGTRVVVPLIVIVVLLTFTLWITGVTSRVPFLIAILVESCIGLALRSRVLQIIEAAEHPARDLDLLSAVVQCIEAQKFSAPLLVRVRSQLETRGDPASKQIRRLHMYISRLDERANAFFGPIAAGLMWGTQFSMAVESWRQRSGASIRQWLAAVGECEALGSLAAYSFEHPNDPFPTLSAREAWFDAEGLGHPLLSEESFVRNDVRLGGGLRLFIVSGSNMSGKSTLLRSVGLNTVMAWAGGPVRAHRLEISPLQVGASLRIVDSLQDGRSRFYAEITRLRQIIDLAGQKRTLLFLVDEMLSGTNSHDRRIGAEALVHTLVERGAIGLITTHDLALADIAVALGDRAANVHLSDTIVNGQLHFDYRLRPGIVDHSNALELMRAVGLDV